MAADDARHQSLRSWWYASARRSAAASGPKAVDSTTAACCSESAPSGQQVGEAIVLSLGCDRLEFGGEAVDATVELVLGLDRLRGREVGAAVLEDAVQHGSRSDVIRLGRGVAVVGLVEGDVRDVGRPRPGRPRPTS